MILKKLYPLVTFVVLGIIFWKIIFFSFSSILSFSFLLDDWPLIWGVSQQHSVFFNPSKVIWNFEDERFTVREGFAQIWATAILYKLYGLQPYFYHFFGLIVKLMASLAITWSLWRILNPVAGIITGLIFASASMGAESLYWYNVNGAYILITIVSLSLPFFIEGLNNKKSFIISLCLISLGIILYPPRAHVFLAYPFLAIIWSRKILNKVLWSKILIIVVVVLLSYKIPSGGGAVNQANRAILHRLIVFSGDGLNAGNHIFFTYPLVSIPLAIFSPITLENFANFPKEPIINRGDIGKARFYTANFITLPITWMILVSFIYFIQKLNNQKINKNKYIIWLGTGFVLFVGNELLRRFFLESRFWDSPTHFLFTLALIIILFSLMFYNFFREQKPWDTISKIFISSIVLLVSSYIINWAFDPLIHPGSTGISRYLTVPTVFGSIFFATFLYTIILLATLAFNKFKNVKDFRRILIPQVSLLSIIVVVFFIFHTVSTNVTIAKTFVEKVLLPIRSHQKVNNILNNIVSDIKDAPKPQIILLDTWDYAEVFSIFVHTGHSLAIWNNISNPKEFPLVYYDEKILQEQFPGVCKRFKISDKQLFRFKVEVDKASNISDQFPKLSCENQNLKVR